MVTYTTSDQSVDFKSYLPSIEFTEEQKSYLSKSFNFNFVSFLKLSQVHGCDIEVVSSEFNSHELKTADAAITNLKNVVLTVRTADCLPIFIINASAHSIGLVHAGWKGTELGIAAKTIEALLDTYYAKPEESHVIFGPAIGACCYEVGDEFRERFNSFVISRNDKNYFDLKGENKNQLLRAGVKEENIIFDSPCTCCNKNYHSYRRDNERAGRMLSAIVMKG